MADTTLMSWFEERNDIVLDIDSSASLTESLIRSVTGACDKAEDAADAVVVLRVSDQSKKGAPVQWPGRAGVHLVNKWERAVRRLERTPHAVIAVVQGPASGLALELILASDYRIATADLTLTLPMTDGKIWPSMALHRLSQQIGVAGARRLALFGMEIHAERALTLGIVDDVVDGEEALAEAVSQTVKLAAELEGNELAVRRRLLLDAATTAFEESLGAHLSACDRTLRRTRTPFEAESA